MSFDPMSAGKPLWYRKSVPHLSISSHSFPAFASQYRLKYPAILCIPAVFSPIVGVFAGVVSRCCSGRSSDRFFSALLSVIAVSVTAALASRRCRGRASARPPVPDNVHHAAKQASTAECFNISETSKGNERFYNKTGLPRIEILFYTYFARIGNLTKLRISIVQYLNTAPLVWGFTNGPLQGKYDLSFTVPSQCAEALRAGRADVAIVPAIEYQRIPGLAILPDMAIASKNQVRSLLIVAKKPIEQVKTLALDSSSRSTQALTRILGAEKWRIAPQFNEAVPDLPEMLHNSDAALLIGDPALRVSLGIESEGRQASQGQTVCQAATLGITSSELLYVCDAVAEWRALTGLPAVLAVWAVRRELATAELTADFLASRDFGLAHLGEIRYEAAQDLELPQRGLELYFEQAARLGLIPQASPIHWAAAKSEALKL